MFYAVYRGKNTGIYYTWDECKLQVIGYKGACYKKFNSLENAQSFLEKGISYDELSLNNKKKLINNLSEYVDVYTDGSLIRKDNYIGCGYGIYIPKFNIKISSILDIDKTNNRAELKAIIDSIELMKSKNIKNLQIHTDSQYSILIYGNTGLRYKEKNFNNIKNRDLVINALKSKENMNLYFNHIKAHTGSEDINYLGNDLADDLANKAAVTDYINQNKNWLNNKIKIGKYDNFIKNIPKEYINNYINSPSYIKMCKKNESFRTIKNILIYYINLAE